MNQAAPVAAAEVKPLRFQAPPAAKWRRAAMIALFYLVAIPGARVLALFGKWPQLLGRGMAKANERAKSYTPTARDVLVCAYFKTGTNWTMQIAIQIAHRGKAKFEHIHELVPWIEIPPKHRMAVPVTEDSVWQSCPTGLRVIKTHASFDHLIYTPEAKYIWVVRDPKDVFVSSYHFVRDTALGPLMPTPEQWLDLFLSPDTPAGSWAVHVDGGWRHRHKPNLLFLTYEEMKKDLPATVRQIAELMQVDLTEEEFGRVLAQSDFAHMRSIGHKFDPPAMPWSQGEGSMIRRGESGSAGELLNEEQKQRIDDYWRAELKRLGSDFPYDAKFARR
jgi:hypothetical protein